ncbi:hypothetical protein GYMLUDRAFT_56600 [Collybiopsis luxurians FD-317 M1]|nr:hypothetical protein GYMLUDRAFT_56600 [Collybiopsis luxurians FD-317 M1]
MIPDDSILLVVHKSEMPPSTVIDPGENEGKAFANLFNILGNGDLMRLRRVCRGMQVLVDQFMTRKLDVDTALTVYLGTASRARRLRKHQQELGAVFSGLWSYLFLCGAALLAPKLCPLDIFLDHSLVPKLGNVLRPMGFQYCSAQGELVPDHRHHFQEAFEQNDARVHSTSAGSFLYCFTNCEVMVRVFGATHGIVHAIFEQGSSGYFPLVDYKIEANNYVESVHAQSHFRHRRLVNLPLFYF